MITRASREVDERHRPVVKALRQHHRDAGAQQQIVSDQQLHYAQTCSNRSASPFHQRPKAILDDLTMAYNQLTTALSVR